MSYAHTHTELSARRPDGTAIAIQTRAQVLLKSVTRTSARLTSGASSVGRGAEVVWAKHMNLSNQ